MLRYPSELVEGLADGARHLPPFRRHTPDLRPRRARRCRAQFLIPRARFARGRRIESTLAWALRFSSFRPGLRPARLNSLPAPFAALLGSQSPPSLRSARVDRLLCHTSIIWM